MELDKKLKELIIGTLGTIIDCELDTKVEITLSNLAEPLKEKYKENIFWKFSNNNEVQWICFWVSKLARNASEGIFPIFYKYAFIENDKEKEYLILSFGKSVKVEVDYDWDNRLPAQKISKFFYKRDAKNISSYKNEINYGTSKVFEIYDMTKEDLNSEEFQNRLYSDFKVLFEYYISYAKLKDYYKKNLSSINSEEKSDSFYMALKSDYEEKFEEILTILSQKTNKNNNKNSKNREIICNENEGKINFSLNNILFGPPGTGKTYKSIFYSVAIAEKNMDLVEEKISEDFDDIFKKYKNYQKAGRIKFITFHQSYGYEDFIEGIKPVLNATNENELSYELFTGIFKEMCINAIEEEDKNFVLIIDEINRGNISKIFGELITLIETSKRLGEKEELKVVLPYSKEEFGVPKNLYIIGTMNTADKSIAHFDTALRRRFNFIEMLPDFTSLEEKEIEGINLGKLLLEINNRIEFFIGRDYMIGHSYFLKVENLNDLAETFEQEIIPLLEEYFYDDYEKIRVILGNNKFITYRKQRLGSEEKRIYNLNKNELRDIKNYKKIYEFNNTSREEN